MGIFPFSALALLLAVQVQPPSGTAAPAESAAVEALSESLPGDSADGRVWLAAGQRYLDRALDAYRRSDSGLPDTSWLRASLDSAEEGFGRAATLLDGTPAGDTAAAMRIGAWAERGVIAWTLSGKDAALSVGTPLSPEVRLPALLEELGENLLRACPRGGVLLTAGPVDTYAAWYMHVARELRRDLAIVPLIAWRTDSAFRRRVIADHRLEARETPEPDAGLGALTEKYPLCVSMALAEPPEIRRGLKWKTRPLLWVAGRRAGDDAVPAQDFVFAALRLAADSQAAWLDPVLEVYRRAAGLNSGLCESLEVYGMREEIGCQ